MTASSGDAAPAWKLLGASVRGASHVRDGSPNQDALLLLSHGRAAIAAVADGHGGARHFRSAEGAQLAVQAAFDALCGLSEAIDSGSPARHAELVAGELPRRIVSTWVDGVYQALGEQPITDDEWERLGRAEGAGAVQRVRDDPLLAYGATLLFACAWPAPQPRIVLGQLGDGDVVLVRADGHALRPLPADERLLGNFTTSICRAGAEADFRCAVLDGDAAQAALLLLSTDGYANSFRTDGDYLQVGADLLALLRRQGEDAVLRQLPGILEHASEHGSGDDITLALLADSQAMAAPVPGGAASAAEPLGDGPRAAAQPKRRLPMFWLASLALVAVLAWTQRDRIAAAWGQPRVPGGPDVAIGRGIGDPEHDSGTVAEPASAPAAAPPASAASAASAAASGAKGKAPAKSRDVKISPASKAASAAPSAALQ